MKGVVTTIAITLIRLYRVTLSSWSGPACRFSPSCSHYTEQAIQAFGPWRGGWMGLRRIARCHPWHPGGYDPVPTSHPRSTTPSSPRADSTPTPTDVLRSVPRT